MALGYPAVTPLRDRSEVAARIEAIRQRLKALDDEVTRLGSVADASSVAGQVTTLQRSLLTLSQRVTVLESALGTTDTFTLTASEAITQFQVVVPSGPNQCKVCDPSDPHARSGALGVAITGGSVGQAITIQRRGQLTLTISGLEAGRPVYAAPGGTISQDSSYAATAVIVGTAMSSSVIWVGAGAPTLLSPGHYPDPFDDAMPVAWGVVAPLIRMLEQLLVQPNGFVVLVGGELGTTGSITGAP